MYAPPSPPASGVPVLSSSSPPLRKRAASLISETWTQVTGTPNRAWPLLTSAPAKAGRSSNSARVGNMRNSLAAIPPDDRPGPSVPNERPLGALA